MNERSVKWHIIFWFLLVIAGVASLSPYYQSLVKATLHRVIFLPVWFLATYINLYILMPKYWDSKKWINYFGLLFFLVFTLTIVQRFICINYIYPKYFWMRAPNIDELNIFWLGPFIQFISYIILPVVLTAAIREGLKWYRESVQSREFLADQQAAELNYLKAQINPHFLFNTLNSLYGLSLESSTKVPSMILKLSDILSYSLYESSADRIPAEKEISLIKDFMALETERYSERLSISFEINDNIHGQEAIAPLLLMPLVENAFKHGVKESTDVVNIHLTLAKDGDLLFFKVINDFSGFNSKEAFSGIGLTNLRRRLTILYQERYMLETKIVNGQFHSLIKFPVDV